LIAAFRLAFTNAFLEGVNMREQTVTLPELALVAGTRVVLGAGLGLLLAGSLSHGQRWTVGWTLVAIGALTTIPLAVEVLGKRTPPPAEEPRGAIASTKAVRVPAQA
jgi:hypothetical protein